MRQFSEVAGTAMTPTAMIRLSRRIGESSFISPIKVMGTYIYYRN
jgi:hypothetical protein